MDYTFGSSEKKSVVFDLGASYIKCGFAGEAYPRHVIKSQVRPLWCSFSKVASC
jgi:actin-related protein